MTETPILGLTGPTGSGKGLLAAWFAARGAAVIDCDRLSREVTQAGSPCLQELVAAFSEEILCADGSLDRAALARRAFASDAARQTLNRITHPHILALARKRAQEAIAAGVPLVVMDAPTLFESGLDADCSHTAAVLAPQEMRLRRILQRDGLTEDAAKQRMAAQPNDTFYRERATTVFCNDGTPSDLYRQAEEWWACTL